MTFLARCSSPGVNRDWELTQLPPRQRSPGHGIDRGPVVLPDCGLVQIGHGVTVGHRVRFAAQVGIAGSTVVEDDVVLAGQVGVAGHLTLGAGVVASAQTGIPNSVDAGEFVSGYPAIPNRDWLKASAVFRRLPALKRRRLTASGEVPAYFEVYRRDAFRCSSPVCTRRDVTPHHLRFRAAGGGDEIENLTTLCVWCHLRGVHSGRLSAAPPASHIRWTIGRNAIIEVEGRERIVGIKNVTINEQFFQGHFPGHPIMPGVLIIEAMAQVGGMLLMSHFEGQNVEAMVHLEQALRLDPGDAEARRMLDSLRERGALPGR